MALMLEGAGFNRRKRICPPSSANLPHPAIEAGGLTLFWFGNLTKQVAVRSRAFKADVGIVFGQRVNQNPVGFDVAIAAAGEIAAQRMILALRRQDFPVNQPVEHGFGLLRGLCRVCRQV